MAWKTESSGGDFPVYDGSLPDDEKIVATLVRIEPADNKFNPKKKRYMFILETEDFEQQEIQDWMSVTVNEYGNDVAKMRKFVNAIEGRPSDEKVFAIDDESLEYFLEPVEFDSKGRPERDPDGKIEPGVRVCMMGVNATKATDDGEKRTYFNIEKYRPAPAAKKANSRRRDADEDEAPRSRSNGRGKDDDEAPARRREPAATGSSRARAQADF